MAGVWGWAAASLAACRIACGHLDTAYEYSVVSAGAAESASLMASLGRAVGPVHAATVLVFRKNTPMATCQGSDCCGILLFRRPRAKQLAPRLSLSPKDAALDRRRVGVAGATCHATSSTPHVPWGSTPGRARRLVVPLRLWGLRPAVGSGRGRRGGLRSVCQAERGCTTRGCEHSR